MTRFMLKSKIHRATVTDSAPHCHINKCFFLLGYKLTPLYSLQTLASYLTQDWIGYIGAILTFGIGPPLAVLFVPGSPGILVDHV